MFRVSSKHSDIVTPLEPYHTSLFGPPIKQIEYAGLNDKDCFFGTNFREMVRSAYRKGERQCICNALTPLRKTFQLMGIFPVSYDASTCEVTHSWTSVFALINWVWFWGNIALYIYAFTFAASFVALFRGTDFYTVSLVIITQFLTTEMVFFVGNFRGAVFCKAWELLHRAGKELYITDFGCIKRITYFIPVYLFGEAALMMTPMMLEQDPAMQVTPGVFITAFVANVIPNFTTASFSVMMWIIGIYFDRVNIGVKSILYNSAQESRLMNKGKDQSAVDEMTRLRNIHADLCDCVRYFASAFGPQLLFIFGSTLFRFIAGIYAVTTTITGLAPKRLAAFTMNNFIASTLAIIRITLVLNSSEHVVGKSNKPIGALLKSNSPQTRGDLRTEVAAFLDKIGKFPLEITCCGIHKLDPSYMASAIPSIITYVLVLMQFKQGDYANASSEASSQTI